MQPHKKLSLDDASISELYQRQAQTLLAFIRRSASTREDAEDVLLEVFLAAFENQTLVDVSDGQQLAWLRRVAHNKCVDLHRCARHRPSVSLDSVAEFLFEDEAAAPEQVALRSEEHALLRRHLAHLPEQQQAVLRFAHGLRSVEIARRLNKSESAVRMLLSCALNLLRGIYKQQMPGGNDDEQAR